MMDTGGWQTVNMRLCSRGDWKSQAVRTDHEKNLTWKEWAETANGSEAGEGMFRSPTIWLPLSTGLIIVKRRSILYDYLFPDLNVRFSLVLAKPHCRLCDTRRRRCQDEMTPITPGTGNTW